VQLSRSNLNVSEGAHAPEQCKALSEVINIDAVPLDHKNGLKKLDALRVDAAASITLEFHQELVQKGIEFDVITPSDPTPATTGTTVFMSSRTQILSW